MLLQHIRFCHLRARCDAMTRRHCRGSNKLMAKCSGSLMMFSDTLVITGPVQCHGWTPFGIWTIHWGSKMDAHIWKDHFLRDPFFSPELGFYLKCFRIHRTGRPDGITVAGIASPSLEEMDIDWARTSSDTVVAHPKMADVQLYDCIA